MTIKPLQSGSVIGIVGGGQLGRMMAQAAAKLGLRASIFAPEMDAPAFEVAAFRHCAPYHDSAALERFAREADAVTYEFENIPADALAIIERHSRLAPNRRALEVSQDRIEERRFLTSIDLPVAPYAEVRPEEFGPSAAVADALEKLSKDPAAKGFYLKRARLGYDGKGQMRIGAGDDVADEIADAVKWLGYDAALLEQEIPFLLELSVLCVRDGAGEKRFYDCPQNIHRKGILRESIVPAPVSGHVAGQAREFAARIANALDYIGVIAVEMFLVRDGHGKEGLLINEIAPRVHNSGHWTADACAVSQFENHIRAVAGWPLGSTERHSDARMVNLLGEEALGWRALLEENPSRSLTLYGKKDAVNGRKMGHYVDLTPKS